MYFLSFAKVSSKKLALKILDNSDVNDESFSIHNKETNEEANFFKNKF